jgi:hypothetical protein
LGGTILTQNVSALGTGPVTFGNGTTLQVHNLLNANGNWTVFPGAAIVNGGFETGTFAGWTVIGDASVQTASLGVSPPNGCCMALLTTINTGVPFSLNFGASDVIGSFLGYSPFELSHIPGRFEPYPFSGQSGIKQTVQGHAGELLSFDSYWVTMDGIGTDGGVVSIVPSTSGPKVLLFLNPTNSSGATETGSPVPLCQHDGR